MLKLVVREVAGRLRNVNYLSLNFDVLITVNLSIILVINQLNAQSLVL